MNPHTEQIARLGYCVVNDVFDEAECDHLIDQIKRCIVPSQDHAIQSGGDRAQRAIVGARNLIDSPFDWQSMITATAVRTIITQLMGPHAALVRVLFFDKPPGSGWSLAIHKDRTLAVKQHVDPPAPFSRPTTKAGVPHVVATDEFLAQMLTVRIHLDPMHDDNGPLVVVPGSHRDQIPRPLETVHCSRGDVFVMRPLLSHGSRAAKSDTTDHRRVLHLELASSKCLPGEYQWHRCLKISA